MTIHNIYIVAGVVLWLYILLCLLVKIHIDRCKKRKQQKYRAMIKRFFSPELSHREREKTFRRLSSMIQDDMLLDYACSRYRESIRVCTPEEANSLDIYMKRLLHSRAENMARLSPAARCLLMESFCRCGFEAESVRHFLKEHGCSSELESQWAAQLSRQQQTEMVR